MKRRRIMGLQNSDFTKCAVLDPGDNDAGNISALVYAMVDDLYRVSLFPPQR